MIIGVNIFIYFFVKIMKIYFNFLKISDEQIKISSATVFLENDKKKGRKTVENILKNLVYNNT